MQEVARYVEKYSRKVWKTSGKFLGYWGVTMLSRLFVQRRRPPVVGVVSLQGGGGCLSCGVIPGTFPPFGLLQSLQRRREIPILG